MPTPNWKQIVRERLPRLEISATREADVIEELAQLLDDRYAAARAAGCDEQAAYARALERFPSGEALGKQILEAERPAAARVPARLRPENIETKLRRTPRGNMLQDFLQDIRGALRMLKKNPGFSAVVVLTLALGIGANSAIFSVMDAVLLKTLPVKDPERLVLFEWRSGLSFRISGMSGTSFVSAERDVRAMSLFRYEVFARMRQAHAGAPFSPLSDFFAFAPIREINSVVAGRQAEVIDGQAVSGGYFAGLGVQPAFGRAISEQDDAAGAQPVVVLSHDFWRKQFNGDTSVIGRPLKLNQHLFTIIGVTPPSFSGTLQVGYQPAITIPLASEPLLRGASSRLSTAARPGSWWINVMGRLNPGATREQARSHLNAAFQAAALDLMPPPRRTGQPAQLEPKDYPRLLAESGSRGMLDRRRMLTPTISGLFLVVALVLLIACANVANLLLARATSRRAEISVRLALGASRGRLVRQLLTESVVLASLGGAVGLLLAIWGNRALVALAGQNTGLLPGSIDVTVNWRVMVFALVVSCLTGVLFGLAPALRATRASLASALKQDRRATGAVSRLSRGLIVGQVALSLLLLVGAGLFLRTLHNLQRVNLGFNQENLLVFRMQPAQAGYSGDRLVAFYRRLFARLDNLSGVRAATFGHVPPLGDNYYDNILLPGEEAASAPRRSTAQQMVRENYFAVMEIPLLRGRNFTAQDDARAPHVGIVNQTFAHKFFPKGDALGKRIKFRDYQRTVEIVGIVADTKYYRQREETPQLLYTPWQQEQEVLGTMYFSLRTAGNPAALAGPAQQAVRELDSDLPLTEIGSQTVHSESALGQERLTARLLSFFGALALMLAAIGLSGVLAYSVSQRTNEIGIRMAIGAQARDVLSLVIGQGMKLVALGLAIGAAGGYGLQRWMQRQSLESATWHARMRAQLYEVSLSDPFTLGMVGLLLLSVALLACWVPARRAVRVDPLIAVRHE